MKRRLYLAGALVLALGVATFVNVQPAMAAAGIRVSGTNIVEANGSTFVMRGTSHAHAWYASHTGAFSNIKSLGANTVRVVLSGGRWSANSASDVANVISLCKQNRLICVLEDHDTTGYGEDGAAYSLSQAVSYWTSIKSVLQGQESYVIINIGNEPYGNTNPSNWTAATVSAVQAMRNAGFQHALMVDAPNWGQDNQGVMRSNAATVENADSQRNTIFSVHMYSQYAQASAITSYVSAFKSAGLPLVIGEFGWKDNYGDIDEDTIMSTAQAQGVGYLGWSWSGNGSDVAYLDQSNGFNVNSLTSWGTRLFNGSNGIKQTAREASIFGSRPTTTSPRPSSASPSTPSGGGTRGCSATYTLTGSWQGGFQSEVKITAGASAISGWTASWTFGAGQTISSSWNAAITSSGASVTAKNVSYNGSLAAGASTTFGFVGSGSSGSTPSVSCTAA
ncbi:cellulase family glycosylhydrolase [Dactylosporangium sp. NPDC051541]|uniref:cellulase family glycosylhydrolase n=1 Tax=Dactylosporangium sp. NPDC051541 TaxID=3363977 RepID=UPI003797BADE